MNLYKYRVFALESSRRQASDSLRRRLSISLARTELLVCINWRPAAVRLSTLVFRLSISRQRVCTQNNAHNLSFCLTLTRLFSTFITASANLISVTHCDISFGARGFRSAAPAIWNSLASNVHSCETYILPTPEISSFPFSLCHCLVTHLSASDSFTTTALTYLLTYFGKIIGIAATMLDAFLPPNQQYQTLETFNCAQNDVHYVQQDKHATTF